MKHSITQSLSWLHTWAGLILGWALVAIFFTGTLAVFDKEIQQWLQPEIPAQQIDQAQAAATAIRYLQAQHGHDSNWQVSLPTERWPRLAVGAGQGQGGGGRGSPMTSLDPVSGEVLKARESAGGNFFFRFHYTLHLPRNIGVWVVGFMAMAMLAAIVSGIVIHKKFFKEFFTFRPNKGQRSWLDYHNASGVLLLPFHIMITYTGLVIFFLIYMPAPLDALFAGDRNAYQAAMRGEPAPNERGPRGAEGNERRAPGAAGEERAMAAAGERGGERGGERAQERGSEREQGPREPLLDRSAQMDFPLLLAKAEAQLGPLAGFSLQRRANGDAVFEARPVMGNIIELTKGRSLGLDALSAKVVKPVPDSAGASWVQRVMAGLHFAQFGGYPMRWLYFLCGMISSAMMAAGLVLFTVKRRRRYGKETPAARFGYEFIERVNIAIVAGLPLASIGLLWANRMLPADLAGRAAHEVNAFFAIWGLSFLHASLRPWAKAWPEQLYLAGALAIGLPLANSLSGLSLFGTSSSLYLELTCIVMGILAVLAGWRAAQPETLPPVKARKGKAEPVKHAAEERAAC